MNGIEYKSGFVATTSAVNAVAGKNVFILCRSIFFPQFEDANWAEYFFRSKSARLLCLKRNDFLFVGHGPSFICFFAYIYPTSKGTSYTANDHHKNQSVENLLHRIQEGSHRHGCWLAVVSSTARLTDWCSSLLVDDLTSKLAVDEWTAVWWSCKFSLRTVRNVHNGQAKISSSLSSGCLLFKWVCHGGKEIQ